MTMSTASMTRRHLFKLTRHLAAAAIIAGAGLAFVAGQVRADDTKLTVFGAEIGRAHV